MCEAIVYLEKNGEQRLLMENVISIRPEAEQLILVDLFGEVRNVPAKIKEVKLLEHKVILTEESP